MSESGPKDFRGVVLAPADTGYEDARKLYNGMIDKRPLLIAQCSDVADVITAVNFAREQQMPIAVRGGGHSGPGLGSVDDGLVVELSAMKGVRVDPATGTVRVGPGCTSGDVDHATHPFGLAVPFGIISTTGRGGPDTGRRYRVPDAQIRAHRRRSSGGRRRARRWQRRRRQRGQNPDLFWALRGGGGNSASSPASFSRRIRSTWCSPGRSPSTSRTRARSCSATGDFLPTAPKTSAYSSA